MPSLVGMLRSAITPSMATCAATRAFCAVACIVLPFALAPQAAAQSTQQAESKLGSDAGAASHHDAGVGAPSDVEVGGASTTGGEAGATGPQRSPPVLLTSELVARPSSAESLAVPQLTVMVVVATDGSVSEARIEDDASVPAPFAEAARAHALRQRFSPAMVDGKAVAARVRLALRFAPPSSLGAAPTSVAADAPTATAPVMAHAEPSAGATTTPEFGAKALTKAGASQARSVAASDLRITVGALHDVPRQDAMQLMTLAPGVVLTNHSGEGHAYATYMRGFSAGEGQDLEVRVEGIPINEPSNSHGHGYADTHFLIPELVEQVRVLEGPFDGRQGDFAAAGTAEFSLSAREPGAYGRAGYGSYGRRRALLAWSPPQASRKTFAAVDLTDSEGFGPNRASANARALGQIAGKLKNAEYRFFAASHALRFDSAGVVREDAVRRGDVSCGARDVDAFYCFLDPNQGGQAARHLASVELMGKRPGSDWTQQLTLMYRTSRFRENFTGALLDPRGDGLDQATQTTTLAARGSYRVQAELNELPQQVELGYEGRFDLGQGHVWRIRRDGQVPYLSVFDHEYALSRISVYALVETSLAPWLSATVAARADTYGYDVTELDRPNQDLEGPRLTMQSKNAWGTNYQPRASLALGPLATLSWVNSVGIGSRSSDAAALSEGEVAPFSRVWAAESGLVSARADKRLAHDARAAFFYAYVDRDMLFDETRGRNVPVGATNRYGAYVHARLRTADRIDSSASFTWAEAYQPAKQEMGFASGPRLPFVPRFVARGDVALYQPWTLRRGVLKSYAGMGVSWVGPRPLPLNTLSRPIFTLDASLRARFRIYEIALEGTNLTDRQNRSAEYFYASDFSTDGPSQRRVRHFSAAPPRMFMASVAVLFDLTTDWENP